MQKRRFECVGALLAYRPKRTHLTFMFVVIYASRALTATHVGVHKRAHLLRRKPTVVKHAGCLLLAINTESACDELAFVDDDGGCSRVRSPRRVTFA